MCGFAGILAPGLDAEDQAALFAMSARIVHRGPDDEGVWSDADAGVGLAHRRLSILDVSAAGHQPMRSVDGRYTIAFNGEIYNHLDVRARLRAEGHDIAWRGNSDTETMLAAFVAWGVDAALERLLGMFAFAVWDAETREVILARDRLGEKPLYFGRWKARWIFGSDLAALRAHPACTPEIDRDALTLLLRFNCIPAPHTIHRECWKVEPGTVVRLGAATERGHTTSTYWSLDEVARRGVARRGDVADPVAAVDAKLQEVVRRQMLSDVPLGALLSGGIDSTLVTALMQKASDQPVKTFTIGTDVAGYDEAEHADAVARHLGTEHVMLRVTGKDAQDVIPELPSIYSEPFADSSQIPTFLVCRLARESVTVALTGDGADEVFGGYNRYVGARRAWERLRAIPAPGRQLVTTAARGLSPATWDRLFRGADPVLPASWRLRNPGDKLHKLAGVLDERTPDGYFARLVSHWTRPEEVVRGAKEPDVLARRPFEADGSLSFEEWMMVQDGTNYMPDDILVKVDRASMASSLETRAPYLDPELIELAWSLAPEARIQGGHSKWVLREVLAKYVPRPLFERPKSGFGIPLDDWLRGDLRDWCESLIATDRLRREGWFEPAPIRRAWKEHLEGSHNRSYLLWDVLMFQAWHEATAAR